MSSTLTRAERSALTATARRIRTTAGQHQHRSVTEIANAIRATVPLHPLEAHWLTYGWSRRQVVEAVAEVYRAEDRGLPGLTDSMLCRWEHDGAQPDPDHAHALGIVRLRPRELGLTETASRPPSGMQRRGATIPEPPSARCYARPASSLRDTGGVMSEPSSSSLTAVRESLALALSTNPDDADAHEQLDGAVPHTTAPTATTRLPC